MSSLKASDLPSTSGQRPASTWKYILSASLAVVLLRVIIYVAARGIAIDYHKDGTFSFMPERTNAFLAIFALGLIALPCYALAGALAARRTQNPRAGARAGLKTGLLSGFVTYLGLSLPIVVFVLLVLLIAGGLSHEQSGYQRDSQALIWWTIRAILFNNLLIIVFDGATGWLMGWLGGMLVRRKQTLP